MDAGNRGNRSAALTEQHIAEVDRLYVSPGERANYIWALLKSEHPDLTDWDVICFAGEFLGMMSSQHLWLTEAAKRVVGLIYAAHYMNAEQIDANSTIKRSPPKDGGPPPNREERSEPDREHKIDSDRTLRTRFWTGG